MRKDHSHRKFEAKLEDKAFLTFHKDGLIDILMGWILLVIGVNFYLDTMSAITAFIALTPLLFFLFLKIRITLPRLGHAQFRIRRTPSRWILGGFGVFLILVAIVSGVFLRNSLGGGGSIAIALIGIAFVMVFVSGINRILAYAVLIPVYFIVGFGLRFLSPVMIIATGAVLMVIGIYMLVKFLRTYPLQDEEEDLV
jgi:hypothetical protein